MPSAIIGIYRIVNKVNSKYYVGSSINTARRRKEHFTALRENEHVNDYLQNAWNKHGESSFVFEVVSILPSSTTLPQLLSEEQKWLNIAETDPLSYNLTFVAGCPTSNLSYYSKQKRSKALRNVPRTPEWIAKISKSHLGIRPSKQSRLRMRRAHLGKKQTLKHAQNAAATRRKHWAFLAPDGQLTNIYDLKRFCRENDLHSGAMYWVAQGKRTQHKGWRRYEIS